MANSSDVWELTSDGRAATSRLLYPAGSPEAEAFHAKYGDPEHPVDLDPPVDPDSDDGTYVEPIDDVEPAKTDVPGQNEPEDE